MAASAIRAGGFFISENVESARMAGRQARSFLCRKERFMGPEIASGRVEVLNGVQLYFEVHGSGEPLILLHGFSGCSQDWIEAAGKHHPLPLKDSRASSLVNEWGEQFQIIVPDMRGHGRSAILAKPFRHQDAAFDMFALLDHLGIRAFKGIGISGGGNVLLHMATKQPERVKAMVLVSATSYFPPQARVIMRQYAETLRPADRDVLRKRHPGGNAQIESIVASVTSFADSYDDLNLTKQDLATITARTLIIQGDRDPLYPVEISVEMARAIPRSSLWIVPNAGHGPIIGERWPEFVRTAAQFQRD
jgi:pimeloyl-ACP methyl ester carboxylesterase